MGKSTQAKARDFSEKARKEIYERDGGCIFCQMGYHMEDIKGLGGTIFSVMHYIPKSRNGLGIAKNGAVGCQIHHDMMDNGRLGRRDEMLELYADYMRQQYEDWDESQLTYNKWAFLEGGQ